MSRTIRRKNAKHEYRWSFIVGRLEDIDAWDMHRFGGKTPEQCLQRKRARFHSDHYARRLSPPRWLLRQHNHRLARASDRELHRCLVADQWDDHQQPRLIRSAYWDWC